VICLDAVPHRNTSQGIKQHYSTVSAAAAAAATLPRLHKEVSGEEIAKVAGVGYPHTSHCLGSGDILISTMGDPAGKVRGREGLKRQHLGLRASQQQHINHGCLGE
jgi:hypothetical protein